MSNNKTQLLNGYWVIGTNKWDANIYTQEQAEKNAETLINCTNCISCSYCSDCSDCRSCRSCSYCSYCSDCSDCSYCSYCSSCRSCSDCSYCSDFKSNPERITSPKIGSRNSQTTYYWNDEKELIVCGCFKGTLEEFEAKVKKTHGDNQHAHDYFKWIERINLYKEVTNETI